MSTHENEIILPEVPEIYTVITGYDQQIAELANQFFDSILAFIGYNERAITAFTERHDFFLRRYIRERELPDEEQYLHTLLARGYTIASVLVTRDDGNACQVASTHYLTPDLVVKLREGIVKT